MKKIIFILIIILAGITFEVRSQTVIQIDPLFEYPTAPEELESIQDKCNYLVKNFWNNFDFKKKSPVDQYALNEAFQVYVTAFQYAGAKEAEQSIDKLVKNLSGNQILLMQFCKAAEENLYGPRADFWSDELYLKFLDAVIKDKKIAENRKNKYIKQAQALRKSDIGNKAPEFWFQDAQRESKRYFPMSTPTLLIFGDPESTDWRLSRLRMESNYQLEDALKKGKVNILYIIPTELDNWKDSVSNYNPYWTIGQSNDAKEWYDIRFSPAIYLIDSAGMIIKKNLDPLTAVALLLEQVN